MLYATHCDSINLFVILYKQMDPEEYRNKIADEILKIIEDKLTSNQMDAERARKIAKYIVDTLQPNMTIDQMRAAVLNYDKNFSELATVAMGEKNEYDEKIKEIVSNHVSNLLKEGKIDEAHNLVKKALNNEVKIHE